MEIPDCLRHITRSLGGVSRMLEEEERVVAGNSRMMARHVEGSV